MVECATATIMTIAMTGSPKKIFLYLIFMKCVLGAMAQSLTTNVRLKYCQTIGGFYSVAHNTSSNGIVCYGMVWYVISYLSDRGFF